MKWEYKESRIRDGGENCYSLAEEMNALGRDGWEFCAWISDWDCSEGPGPHSREALFKRQLTLR